MIPKAGETLPRKRRGQRISREVLWFGLAWHCRSCWQTCVQLPASAAPRSRAALYMLQGRGILATSEVRPLVMASEARAEMARYSLKAYGKRDATDVVQGRFFMSKPMGLMHRSSVPRP